MISDQAKPAAPEVFDNCIVRKVEGCVQFRRGYCETWKDAQVGMWLDEGDYIRTIGRDSAAKVLLWNPGPVATSSAMAHTLDPCEAAIIADVAVGGDENYVRRAHGLERVNHTPSVVLVWNVKGTVHLRRGEKGRWVTALEDDELAPGDFIRAGVGSVSLYVSDAKRCRLCDYESYRVDDAGRPMLLKGTSLPEPCTMDLGRDLGRALSEEVNWERRSFSDVASVAMMLYHNASFNRRQMVWQEYDYARTSSASPPPESSGFLDVLEKVRARRIRDDLAVSRMTRTEVAMCERHMEEMGASALATEGVRMLRMSRGGEVRSFDGYPIEIIEEGEE